MTNQKSIPFPSLPFHTLGAYTTFAIGSPLENIMNLALWIGAGLLAAVALAGGAIKTFVPQQKLAATPGGRWTEDVGAGVVKALGVLEILAAVGLILPAVVDIAPVLVPVTALCWVLLMIGAMITHGRRGEFRFAVLNLIYLVLAAFIVWGRFGPGSFTG